MTKTKIKIHFFKEIPVCYAGRDFFVLSPADEHGGTQKRENDRKSFIFYDVGTGRDCPYMVSHLKYQLMRI